MIAAVARAHGAAVATRDRDLVGCGVPVVNPWEAA
jgi:predicted nucleic acid-binding protein